MLGLPYYSLLHYRLSEKRNHKLGSVVMTSYPGHSCVLPQYTVSRQKWFQIWDNSIKIDKNWFWYIFNWYWLLLKIWWDHLNTEWVDAESTTIIYSWYSCYLSEHGECVDALCLNKREVCYRLGPEKGNSLYRTNGINLTVNTGCSINTGLLTRISQVRLEVIDLKDWKPFY